MIKCSNSFVKVLKIQLKPITSLAYNVITAQPTNDIISNLHFGAHNVYKLKCIRIIALIAYESWKFNSSTFHPYMGMHDYGLLLF